MRRLLRIFGATILSALAAAVAGGMAILCAAIVIKPQMLVEGHAPLYARIASFLAVPIFWMGGSMVFGFLPALLGSVILAPLDYLFRRFGVRAGHWYVLVGAAMGLAIFAMLPHLFPYLARSDPSSMLALGCVCGGGFGALVFRNAMQG